MDSMEWHRDTFFSSDFMNFQSVVFGWSWFSCVFIFYTQWKYFRWRKPGGYSRSGKAKWNAVKKKNARATWWLQLQKTILSNNVGWQTGIMVPQSLVLNLEKPVINVVYTSRKAETSGLSKQKNQILVDRWKYSIH